MIVVFGSNIYDIFFDAADLPPKDQALHLTKTHQTAPGGKGANQAVACAAAGAKVRFCGAVGSGAHGRDLYTNMGTKGIDVSAMKMLEDARTGVAAIFVDEKDGTHKVVVSQGANKLAKQEWIEDESLKPGNTVLVQGELVMSETEALIVRAKKNGARTMMNLAPVVPLSETMLRNLDYLILNEHEADALGKQIGMETEDKTLFAANLYAKYKLTAIITLGPDGAICCTDQGLITVSALKVTPVDTIGAGDAFVGYFCAGLDKNLPLGDALRQAAVAGSLACTKIGAQTALPTPEEVAARIGEVQVSPNAYAQTHDSKFANALRS